MNRSKHTKQERNQSKGLVAFFLCFYDVRPVESSRYEIVERDSGKVIAHLVFVDRSLKHEKISPDNSFILAHDDGMRSGSAERS